MRQGLDGAKARHRLLLLAVIAATALGTTAAASAAPLRKWNKHTVSYYVGARAKLSVVNAASRWNASGVRFRFVRTMSRTAADVMVLDTPGVIPTCGSGVANMSLVNGVMVKVTINLYGGSARCSPQSRVFAATHEFGHALGLDHETARCSLMNPVGNAQGGMRCPRPRAGFWRCRVIEQIDVARAVRRYGGVSKPVRRVPFCRIP